MTIKTSMLRFGSAVRSPLKHRVCVVGAFTVFKKPRVKRFEVVVVAKYNKSMSDASKIFSNLLRDADLVKLVETIMGVNQSSVIKSSPTSNKYQSPHNELK